MNLRIMSIKLSEINTGKMCISFKYDHKLDKNIVCNERTIKLTVGTMNKHQNRSAINTECDSFFILFPTYYEKKCVFLRKRLK